MFFIPDVVFIIQPTCLLCSTQCVQAAFLLVGANHNYAWWVIRTESHQCNRPVLTWLKKHCNILHILRLHTHYGDRKPDYISSAGTKQCCRFIRTGTQGAKVVLCFCWGNFSLFVMYTPFNNSVLLSFPTGSPCKMVKSLRWMQGRPGRAPQGCILPCVLRLTCVTRLNHCVISTIWPLCTSVHLRCN